MGTRMEFCGQRAVDCEHRPCAGIAVMRHCSDEQCLSFLFPVIFAIPVFDIFSLPFHTSLAAKWMW